MIQVKILGYDPNPICQITDGIFWYPVDALANPVSESSYVAQLFEQWALNPVDQNGDPVVLDPESPNYFFAPGPTPEPLPLTPDWSGFNQSVQPDSDFQAYMLSIPDALNKPLMILLMALNNQGFFENNYNVEQAVSAWNLIVTSYPISEALLTKISNYAQQFNIPFSFAPDGTVEVNQ